MDNFYLTDLIDASVLQQVQDAFSDMVGMAAQISDENGRPVTRGSNFSDFCMEFTRKSPMGSARCEECARIGARTAYDSGKPCFYNCHTGLIDFAAPIVAEGKIIGSFHGGQVLTKAPNKEDIRRVAGEIGVDFEEYWAAAQKIQILSEADVRNATNLLSILTSMLSELAIGKYRAIKANEEISHAAKMKTDFLANMSHEIRTPMNAVIGMAEMALREDIPEAARGYIQQIKSSGRALLSIINDILDFSKIESGKLNITPIQYDTMSLFNDVSNIIMTRLVDKDVTLDLDIDPSLPAQLFGDNLRIRQILINLANNAVKFTNEGTIRISVVNEVESDIRNILKISVSDTGIGIKEKDLNKIFDSFSQVDSTRNRNVEGTGLGLAITRHLVNLMNGTLSVESVYGEGSTFSFTMPQLVSDKTPAMIVRDPDSVYAATLFTDETMTDAFLRDCTRLSVKSEKLSRKAELATVYETVKKEHPGATLFLFLEPAQMTPERKEFIETHGDMVAILVTDFISEVRWTIPNLLIVKKPISCMNLSMIFNREKVSFLDAHDSQDDADFMAPEAWVLIVDDNAVNLTVAEGLLEPLHMKIATANSGKEAIRKTKERHYDLIFMDHMMPEMDGVEATQIIRRMRHDYDDVPIIALTANAVGGAKEMFLEAGMQDFIAKPIEVRSMLSKVKRWLPEDKIEEVTVENLTRVLQHEEAEKEVGTIPPLADLDTDEALKLLGSEKLFWNVLKEYHRLIIQNAKLIKEHAVTEDIAAFTIEVHALKSSSRQIGADELANMAAELEKAGKANDLAYIHEHTDEMLEKYLSYEPVFAPFFAKQLDSGTKAPADADTLKEIFAAFREAMDNLDTDTMDELCDRLMSYEYPEEQKDYMLSLHEASDNIDLDKCEQIIVYWENAL